MKRHREDVLVQHTVQVECIPDGSLMELRAGTLAQLTQALGSSFTLVVHGQLVRLKGADAAAIGKTPPASVVLPDKIELKDLKDLLWQTLATCYDPEIPVNIVELGLIYGCELEAMDDGKMHVLIDMSLTAPGCGMGESIAEEVCDKVLALPLVGEITVNLVFDPPWDRSRMSEAAQLTLGL
ncbi:putative Fe-S cluster assembly protein SufT [Simplicispira psychrophila]|uniref:putative Fe-S cluster assembly protein SufT n=1 Tax=Simplicispira psychrophila TaxID=80882 RepID=UPI000486A621|nr:putative Fe-S cluster assembly protein SufT [Simplicispira psychrophila]